MEYIFKIIDRDYIDYKVNVIINDNCVTIFKHDLLAKFDREKGIPMLQMNVIKDLIPNAVIRQDLIYKLRKFIRESN